MPGISVNSPPGAQFCEQLRQPLCLALLRNCLSDFAEAYSAAGRLFAAVLLQPRLRAAAKAEMGAFYPLLLLRPLEAERPEPAAQAVALAALAPLVAQPQLLVRTRRVRRVPGVMGEIN